MEQVLTYFVTEFALSFTGEIVKACEEEAGSSGSFREEESMELESAPVPSEPLKAGHMTKKGAIVKNWKSRWFVCYNEADNFRIDYLEKEGGKLKGTVSACGYSASIFDEEDDKNEKTVMDKEFGIKLVPYAKDRRTWYFKCDSKDDQEKWLDVLKTACWKSGPQKNKNPLIAEAFQTAYWNTRWQFGLWGSYSAWGTEDERLADLILSVLDREVLCAAVAAIDTDSDFARNAAESAIRKPIQTMVKSAVMGSWRTATAGAEAGCESAKNTIQTSIAPIIEHKQALKTKIVDSVNGVVSPILAEKAGASFLQPILTKACSPIGKAFAKFTVDFNEKMTERLGNGEFSEEKFEHGMRDVEWGMYWTMYKAYDIVHDMCFNELADTLTSIPGVSISSIYYMMRDAMNKVHYDAAFTFQKYVKESEKYDTANLQSILAATMKKMVHDCKLVSKQLIVSFLRVLLDTPVLELMIKPAKALVDPIQAAIDAIPVVSTFLNLSEMTSEVIEKIVADNLGVIVQNGFIGQMNVEFASIKI